MISFLSLTTELRKDPIRDKFVKEYFLPFLPPMLTRLKELKTPYLYLLNALEKVINFDSGVQSLSKQQEQNMRVA
jgi:nitrate reductase assembly molybdenum cofactor insertion protein NarJ